MCLRSRIFKKRISKGLEIYFKAHTWNISDNEELSGICQVNTQGLVHLTWIPNQGVQITQKAKQRSIYFLKY